jgi:hypothetical protein
MKYALEFELNVTASEGEGCSLYTAVFQKCFWENEENHK